MSKQPLHESWVDKLFARMLVRYGAAWIRMWEGIDPAAVKADWAHELAGLTGEALAHGLDHLPLDKPPTSTQFAQLCVRAPVAVRQLPAPKANDAHVQRVLEGLELRINRRAVRGDLAWAVNLRDRERRGDKLTMAQREAWREVLPMEQPA